MKIFGPPPVDDLVIKPKPLDQREQEDVELPEEIKP